MPRRLLGLFHRLGNGLALVEAQRARTGASEHDGLVIAVALAAWYWERLNLARLVRRAGPAW